MREYVLKCVLSQSGSSTFTLHIKEAVLVCPLDSNVAFALTSASLYDDSSTTKRRKFNAFV